MYGNFLTPYMCTLCVSASVNKQVVDLSEELAKKVEDSLRQQEEISSLLAQIVDLQARCKGVREKHTHTHTHIKESHTPVLTLNYVRDHFECLSLLLNVCMFSVNIFALYHSKTLPTFFSLCLQLSHENEELTQHLSASRESQFKLTSEARLLQSLQQTTLRVRLGSFQSCLSSVQKATIRHKVDTLRTLLCFVMCKHARASLFQCRRERQPRRYWNFPTGIIKVSLI